MPAQLAVTSGPDQGKLFPLAAGETMQVGRSQATTIRLTDPAVSRVHFELEIGEDQVILHNISSQGTMVNGKPAVEQALKTGDVIRIGNSELRFVGKDEPATIVPKEAALSANEPLTKLAGQSLAYFLVEEVIARGNSGTVFRALDTRHNQAVALKVLEPAFSKNEEEMQRFVRAMKTMLPVRHANIVTIIGAGKTGPFCWVAMDYIDGESLTQVIQRIGVAGMLDWKHAFRVAVDIARALDYAHGQSIIHRNVTPQNILLRKSDKVALLGDLMLAKALEGSLAQHVTKPGELLGDVAYMAPERTHGGSDIDGRADLYGLGATVYAVLTGRPPFTGDAMADVIAKIRNADPEKPKKYQLSIPDMFQGAVLKLLAKRPQERYQTAAELLKDLERVGKFAGVAL
ncbi:MAG TPA: FHA domain-containing serine/threonine-protein kinase [Gemmataceae bacterium]|nr:FHA domain-containing serine/threonine-protein kinase [Gemmataceae bacterium]